MMRSKIAILLMRIKAERDLSFYKMAQFGRITGPTMSKWFKPVGHKHYRHPTEEHVLKLATSLAFDCEPPPWLRSLFEADDIGFRRGLDLRREIAKRSWEDVAECSGIGGERLAAIINGADMAPPAARLRLLMATLFTPEQLVSANELLQAAGEYVLRVPDERLRRTA